MPGSAKKLEFEFGNSASTLITSLERMLEYITGVIPADADRDDIMFRCKVIITELLTNAIKHAGEGITLFDIENEGKELIIKKTDHGSPLYLVDNHTHAPAEKTESKKLLTADPLNSLYACWESENSIRFISEESSIEDFLSVEQVMEHFGILIISRSSDEFTYTYNKETISNIFRVRIDF
jgi:hypothetical protein